MSAMQGIRMKNPAHPGGFVKSEIIEPLGLSVTSAAQVLGVTRAALSAVLNERAHLSPEMALRVEKAFGVSMDTLDKMRETFPDNKNIEYLCRLRERIPACHLQDMYVYVFCGCLYRVCSATVPKSSNSG